MNHDMICNWLGLPPAQWPPDHYTLLGLPPGERDVERIEHQVHERLLRLRGYQLSHPDQATEAMNRIAQAFVCLTDPQAKKDYDARLISPRTPLPQKPAALPEPVKKSPVGTEPLLPGPRTPAPIEAEAETRPVLSPIAKTLLDWSSAPPPVRDPSANVRPPLLPPILLQPPAVPVNGSPELPTAVPAAIPVAIPVASPVANPILVSIPVDTAFETARSAPEALRGLGTKRALYHRIAQTRKLLGAWDRVGKYLKNARRKTKSPAEEKELVKQLMEIRQLLEAFPPLLGQAGQPGYLVVAIARQQLIAQTFKMLEGNQREALARDWLEGYKLLSSHRDFVRQELRALRKRSWWSRGVRAVRAAINDYPIVVLAALGVLALLVVFLHAR
jgi:hypothetical protein